MKLILLFLLGSCAGMTEGKYKKEYHLEDFTSSDAPGKVIQLLKEKMTKCYPQSDYPVYEKTVSTFDAEAGKGTVAYEIDNQSMGPRPLVLVEVLKDPQGSLVKVYSKGNLFYPKSVFRHHIKKWLDGQKVDCDARGKI